MSADSQDASAASAGSVGEANGSGARRGGAGGAPGAGEAGALGPNAHDGSDDARFRPKFLLADDEAFSPGAEGQASPRRVAAAPANFQPPEHPSPGRGRESLVAPVGAPMHAHATGPSRGDAREGLPAPGSEDPEEDHWPFAPPLAVPVAGPPTWGTSTYPRAIPGPVRGFMAPPTRPWYPPARDGRMPLSQPLYGASFRQSLHRFVAKGSRYVGFASPSEFWWVTFAQGVGWTVLLIGGALINDPSMGTDPSIETNDTFMGIFGLVVTLLLCVTAMPNLALLTRRMHDAGLSGALGFLILVPGLGWLGLFICLLLPSRSPEARNPQWEDWHGD